MEGSRPVLCVPACLRDARRVQAGVVVARVGVLRRGDESHVPLRLLLRLQLLMVGHPAAAAGKHKRGRLRLLLLLLCGGVCVAVARVVAWQLSPTCPCFPPWRGESGACCAAAAAAAAPDGGGSGCAEGCDCACGSGGGGGGGGSSGLGLSWPR